MIKLEHRNESMSQWVGVKKAAELLEKDRASVFRNAMAGRLEFRSKEGHLFIYRPTLTNFVGAPMGAPGRNNSDEVVFTRGEEREAVMAYRERLEQTHEDVIYEAVRIGNYLAIQATVIKPDTPPERLTPKKIKKIS